MVSYVFYALNITKDFVLSLADLTILFFVCSPLIITHDSDNDNERPQLIIYCYTKIYTPRPTGTSIGGGGTGRTLQVAIWLL